MHSTKHGRPGVHDSGTGMRSKRKGIQEENDGNEVSSLSDNEKTDVY